MKQSASMLGQQFFAQIEQFHRLSCRPEMSLKLKPGEMLMLSHVEYKMNETPEAGVKPSDLTGGGFVSKSAVSKLLGSLEEKGYLVRTISQKDRRVIDVQITEAGRVCLEEERRYKDLIVEKIFGRMGEEKMRRLLDLSEELIGYAREEMALEKKRQQKGEQAL